MEGPSPQLRLTSPFGSAARCLLFAGEGHLLLVGDAGGRVCVFDLIARRPVSLLSPSEAQWVSAAPIGIPFGADALPFAGGKGKKNNISSPLLHIEPLAGGSGNTRVLLQQKDSCLSLFDLEAEKFSGSLRTGAFSFCKCACPKTPLDLALNRNLSGNSAASNPSSSNHSPCLLGTQCVAAPVGEQEVAGLFDLRVTSSVQGHRQTAPPVIELRLPAEEVRRAFHKETLASGAGSVQGLGFPSVAFHLVSAYELPSLALWDLRFPKGPLAFEPLRDAQSPPTDLAVAGQRTWVACVEGEVEIVRITKKRKTLDSKAPESLHNNASCNDADRSNNAGTTTTNASSNPTNTPSSHGGTTPSERTVLRRVASVSLFEGRREGGRAFDVPSSCQEAYASFEHLNTENLHLTSLALRADGLVGACGSSAGLVHLYEGKELRFMGALKGHHTAVSAVAWCPTSAWLASGDKEGVLHLWNVYRDTYTRPMKL